MASGSCDILFSPDGSLKVEFSSFEMRMSHSICNPRITYVPTGEVLLDFWDSMLDGIVSFDDAGRLRMHVREYPGTQPGYDIIIDPREGTITWCDQQTPPRRFKRSEEKRKGGSAPTPHTVDASAKPQAVVEAPESSSPRRAPQPARHERVTSSDKLGYLVFLPVIILIVVAVVGGHLLALWTPLSVLPHWIAWWIASGLILGTLVIVILVAFLILFRNHKGN